jgi:hypothetical protein
VWIWIGAWGKYLSRLNGVDPRLALPWQGVATTFWEAKPVVRFDE